MSECVDCGKPREGSDGTRCMDCHNEHRQHFGAPQDGAPMIDGAVLGKLMARLGVRIEAIAARLELSPKEWIDMIEDQGVTPAVAAEVITALDALASEEPKRPLAQQRTPAPAGALAVDAIIG